MIFPLSTLSPRQSLGYLADGREILCVEGFSNAAFLAGGCYRVRKFPIAVQRTVKRMAVSGPDHEHRLTGHDLAFAVMDGCGKEWLFIDDRHSAQGVVITGSPDWSALKPIRSNFGLDALVDSFEIPIPQTLADVNPEHVAYNMRFLEAIERLVNSGHESEFHFKSFQKSDLSKIAIPDGTIYAGEPGCGKNLIGIAWALLKVGLHSKANERLCPTEPVLIVCPGGLIQQGLADYETLLGPAFPGVTRIPNQVAFMSLLAHGGGKLAPGFYMSSFTELAQNKFQLFGEIESGNLADNEIRAWTDFLAKEWKPIIADTPAERLEICREVSRTGSVGIGEERDYPSIPWKVECIYRPSLATLMKDHFAAVVVDEATRIKSENSILGLGVRSLRPKYRLVLTGTPIKNRLPDIFFLAAWACDALEKPNDRWPYDSSKLADFIAEFQVADHNVTLEARAKAKNNYKPRRAKFQQRLGVPTAEIANIQKLWTVLAPVVLRRRKCDISEQEIVPKIHRPIIVPMGLEQAKVYHSHLMAGYYDCRSQESVCAKIMALRTCAAAPCAGSLRKPQSTKPFTPKVHACLEVVRQVLERREQVVIFSPFAEPLDVLHGYLEEACVPHDVLDGRINATKRGQLAMEFKRGLPYGKPVMLAGLKAMSEGYSFHLCNNVVLFAYEWSLDLMLQAIDRVHRINSVKPVSVYSIIVGGTIERKLESMLEEKGSAADIALDGQLSAFQTEEMSMTELLKIAQDEFTAEGLINEDDCLAAWPELRSAIAGAWKTEGVAV